MHPTTQATYQLPSIFAGNYVSEQHGDATQRWLPPQHDRRRMIDFDTLLKSLRSALSIQIRSAN